MFKKIFIILFIFIFNCNSMNLLNFPEFKSLLARQIKKIVPKGKEETEIINKLNDIKLDSDVQTLVLDYLKADYPKYKLIKTISIENFNEAFNETSRESLKDELYINFTSQNIVILHDKYKEMTFLEKITIYFKKNIHFKHIYLLTRLLYVKDLSGNSIETPESKKQDLFKKITIDKLLVYKDFLRLSDLKFISCFYDDGKTNIDYGHGSPFLPDKKYILDGKINCPHEITKKIIAFVKNKKSIIFMNIENGEIISEIIFDNTICDISFSDNKKHLAVAFENGQIQIFEKQEFEIE